MSESLLCGQIARYRKAAGMTQEELGRAVGVSTQAVSRWERGGTPDVALLPAIADRLGVSIDALFGRDGDAPQDMDRQFSQWLQAIPKDDRMMQIFRLLGTHLLPIYVDPNALLFSEGQQTVAETCYMRGVTPDGSLTWLRSQYVTEEGMVLSIITEDFPLYLLLPEPPEGYEVHFAANDDYRKLFAVLSQEGCLELLLFLYHKKFSYYTPSALAKQAGLPLEQVEGLLPGLVDCHLLRERSLELEDGPRRCTASTTTMAWSPSSTSPDGSWRSDAWSCSWEVRERPIWNSPRSKTAKKGAKHEKNVKSGNTPDRLPGQPVEFALALILIVLYRRDAVLLLGAGGGDQHHGRR